MSAHRTSQFPNAVTGAIAQGVALPHNGKGWLTPRGRLALWRPTVDVVFIYLCGRGDGQFADSAADLVDEVVSEGEKPRIFMHLLAMHGYDSKLRTELTRRFLAQLDAIAGIHTVTESRVVSMGVTVANIVLKNIVAHPNEASFVQAMRQSNVGNAEGLLRAAARYAESAGPGT